MRMLTIARGNFHAVAYTADGRFLVSFNSQRSIRIWDLSTFTQRLTCRLHADATGRAILPRLLPLANGMLLMGSQIWDLTPAVDTARQSSAGSFPGPIDAIRLDVPEKAPSFQARNLWTFAVAPDGRSICGVTSRWTRASENTTECHLWDGEGRWLRSKSFPDVFRRTWFAPDGHTLARMRGICVVLWDAVTGQQLTELDHTSYPENLAFSPDGRRLAVAAGRCVWLWDLVERASPFRFPAFRKFAEAIAFSPDGRCLAAGSREGEVRLWDTNTLREIARHDWGIGAVHDLAFAPDGMTMAAAGHRNAIVIWDLE